MDDERLDQIEQLLVAAAAIMEDASAVILSRDGQSLAVRIEHVRVAAAELTSLSQTADALLTS